MNKNQLLFSCFSFSFFVSLFFFLLVFDGSLPKGRRARILVNIRRAEPRCLVSEGIDTIFLIQTSHKMVLNIKTDKANKSYVILLSNELIMQIGHGKEFQR